MGLRKELNVDKTIYNLIDWIQDYFSECGPEAKAIIGMSGGKDSTIAAMLLVKALGKERVIGAIMPNGAMKDINDAWTICEALGITYYTLNIGSVYNTYLDIFPFDLSEEGKINLAPRIRMATLYGLAAAIPGHCRVVNTSNASESYIGYCTKYGDLAGDFALLKNLYVREIYQIGTKLQLEFPNVPLHLITKTPDDGLSGMSDEEKLGFSYEELDAYILDNSIPEFSVRANIDKRHKINLHKQAIRLPAPNVTEYIMEEHYDFKF